MRLEKKHLGRKTLGAFLMLFALVVIAGSCAPCDLNAVGRTNNEKNSMLRIVLGEGGGVAGSWEGYTISGSGLVYAWNGRVAGDNEHEVGQLDPDTVCALWDAVKALNSVPDVDASGSLVRFLSVTVQDSTRKYSWRPQLGTSQSKTVYHEIYDRCISAIQASVKPIQKTTQPLQK